MKEKLQTHHKSTVQSFKARRRKGQTQRRGGTRAADVSLKTTQARPSAQAGAVHTDVDTTHNHALKVKAKRVSTAA